MQPKDDSGSRIEDVQVTRGPHNPYPREIAQEILRRVSDGESLRAVCRSEGMPSHQTVLRWIDEDAVLADQYARAREERADSIFDDLTDIADEGCGDVQRDKLRVDTRKWVLARMSPKKYGDKVSAEVTGKDGERLIPETSDSDAARAILFALAKVRDQAGG